MKITFSDEVDAVLEKIADMDPYVRTCDLNAHMGVDVMTWKSVIGRNGDPDKNANG